MIIQINGLKNPSTIVPPSNFTIKTYYNNNTGSLVAIGNIKGIAAIPAKIDPSKVKITSTSYTVNDKNVAYTISLIV
jgi:hypothetical protein